MAVNLFDYLKFSSPREGAPAPWAARAPRRPRRFDLKLVPRLANWQDDPDAITVLDKIEREPWVAGVKRERDGVEIRLTDHWIETTGAGLEAGGSAEASLGDLAAGRRFSVQFWDANATKALHVGHLRNLAIGNAIASTLTQAGGQVERRSLISDAGRSMGEAMAGVAQSGRHAGAWSDGDEKSDHFVGVCYADYVAAAGSITGNEIEFPEDSQTRELTVRHDDADELLKRVLLGDRDTLELWYKTRAWVIAGQRKTLARLGVAFDRVFFESDFLADASELMADGLRDGRFKRREDGVVVYPTGLDGFEEFPLVRPDGVTTQHMRALAYWMAAPDLEDMTSMQICGTEWVGHVTCRRKLMDELLPNGNGSLHPTHDIFNAMVARQKRALASSEGALLIDELVDWLDEQIDADPATHELRRRHPTPERMASQIALGYFLPYPVARPMEFDQPKLLRDKQSVGWDLVRARARRSSSSAGAEGGRPADDPEYRFAVVQSELYRQHLRLAVERLDVGPLALYLKHLAHWSMERDRGEHVERVVQTLLDRSARGLGLEATR
jgi:arginyl-tRNA synthetase